MEMSCRCEVVSTRVATQLIYGPNAESIGTLAVFLAVIVLAQKRTHPSYALE